MKRIIDKKYLPYILALLAVIIWGHNGYRIFHGLLKVDQISDNVQAFHWTLQNIAADSQLTAKFFIYNADYRDPFQNWLQAPQKKKPAYKKQQAKKQPSKPPPALRLTGILKDASGTMAIVEFPDGAVYFVREKDVIEDVKILRIESNSVFCRFEKQEFSVELVH